MEKKQIAKLLIAVLFITCVIYVCVNNVVCMTGMIVADDFSEIDIDNPKFLIRKDFSSYRNKISNLKEFNKKFHLNLQIGDPVFLICKKSMHETAPIYIDILFIVKLP